MNREEARAELNRRGLLVRGNIDDIRARLENDDARGEFTGDLDMAEREHLMQRCSRLSINSQGSREQLIDRINFYNARKRDGNGNKVGPLSGNRSGLPIHQAPLGKVYPKLCSSAHVESLQKN